MSPCIVDNALTERFIYDFLYIITQTADASNDHLHLEATCFPFVVDYTSYRHGNFTQLEPFAKFLIALSAKGVTP